MADQQDTGDREALCEFLSSRDTPCPACGYSLRGLAGSQCPECGLELRLGVRLEEPAMGALMATLAPLFGLAGASASLIIAFLWLSMVYSDWAPAALWVIPVLGLAGGGAGAVALARRAGRIWFRKRDSVWRQSMAIGAWVGSAAAFVMFMVIAMNL